MRPTLALYYTSELRSARWLLGGMVDARALGLAGWEGSNQLALGSIDHSEVGILVIL